MEANQQPEQSPYDFDFMLTLGMVCLVMIGLTLSVFSAAYIKDLNTLRNVPNLIWNFACGKPTDNEITLPLLLSLSILSFITTGALFGVKQWMKRQDVLDDEARS